MAIKVIPEPRKLTKYSLNYHPLLKLQPNFLSYATDNYINNTNWTLILHLPVHYYYYSIVLIQISGETETETETRKTVVQYKSMASRTRDTKSYETMILKICGKNMKVMKVYMFSVIYEEIMTNYTEQKLCKKSH